MDITKECGKTKVRDARMWEWGPFRAAVGETMDTKTWVLLVAFFGFTLSFGILTPC